MAIPVKAIERVERVSLNLPINWRDNAQVSYNDHQFEIILKEDFINLYIRSDYEVMT